MNQRQRIVTIVLLISWIMILFVYEGNASQWKPLLTQTATLNQPASQSIHLSSPVDQEIPLTIDQETQNTTAALSGDQYQTSLQELIDLYENNTDPALAEVIVFQAISEYNFGIADTYKEYLTTPLDPNLSLYLKLHSDDVRISNVKTIQSFLAEVEDMRIQNMISSDDYVFYRMLSQFWQRNIHDAILLARQISSPKYAWITQKLVSLHTQNEGVDDMPSYYYTAQMAVTLLEYGYFSIAAKIALDISLQAPDYKLPYQILAKAFYMTHEREQAVIYLDLLTQKDTAQEEKYRLLQWIASYWSQDYENALFHLQYSLDKKEKPEIYRYILLSYLALGDYRMATQTWQKILGLDDLSVHDFYTYFSHTFYTPIQENKTFAIYNLNEQLAGLFIYQCRQTLGEHDVCSYGLAGLEFARNNRDVAWTLLNNLVWEYDYSYLHNALWTYYDSIGNTSKAQEHYTTALSLTLSQEEKTILTNKLLAY